MRHRTRWRLAATLVGSVLAGALVLTGSGAQADHTRSNGLHMSDVAQIDSGRWFTCAVTKDGELYCWGGNTSMQLGDSALGARSLPKRVEGFDGAKVRQVSTGVEHACAVTTTGEVWCWGIALNGRLGLAAEGLIFQPWPRRVTSGAADTVFTQVSAGKEHTCAVESTGALWCWGGNHKGQLGDGTTVEQPRPVRIDWQPMGMVSEVSAGQHFTCALSTQKAVWCWGQGNQGKLGNGSEADRNRPVKVTDVPDFISGSIEDIDTGNDHACGVTKDKVVACWGYNGSGRLGAGTPGADYSLPQRVKMDGGTAFQASSVSAGAEHTCALQNTGQAWCWGSSAFGQLGDNTLPLPLERPRPKYPVDDETLAGTSVGRLVQLEAGANHGCALNQEGRAFCWGANHIGQLGDGTFLSHRVPAAVFAPPL